MLGIHYCWKWGKKNCSSSEGKVAVRHIVKPWQNKTCTLPYSPLLYQQYLQLPGSTTTFACAHALLQRCLPCSPHRSIRHCASQQL